MNEQTIALSAGEWQIMEQLWQHHHLTLMELVHLLAPGTGWSKSTIVTMVGRLESKGALRYTEGGKARMYLKYLGLYEYIDDNGTTEYPYFDLQWIEQ